MAAALLAGLLLATAAAPAQTTWHVDAAALSGGDGQTWGTAYNDLQSALDIAIAGDQIWVAAGVYLPTNQVSPFDVRTVTFQLLDGVAVYGALPPGDGNDTFRGLAV